MRTAPHWWTKTPGSRSPNWTAAWIAWRQACTRSDCAAATARWCSCPTASASSPSASRCCASAPFRCLRCPPSARTTSTHSAASPSPWPTSCRTRLAASTTHHWPRRWLARTPRCARWSSMAAPARTSPARTSSRPWTAIRRNGPSPRLATPRCSCCRAGRPPRPSRSRAPTPTTPTTSPPRPICAGWTRARCTSPCCRLPTTSPWPAPACSARWRRVEPSCCPARPAATKRCPCSSASASPPTPYRPPPPPRVRVGVRSGEGEASALSSLRLVQAGGSRLAPLLARRLPQALGCRLQQVFGMAEGLLCYTRLDDPEDAIIHTQGRPLSPQDEVRIVDEHDQHVPPPQVGQLPTRGPYTIRGYYRAPEHNAGSFTRDGYYRTGDLVRRDPAGNLIVEGRIKEQIQRGGEKISAAEVEFALGQIPGVRAAPVGGVPDDLCGA